MLRFFSKMRYKLAVENRTAKYLRYAVGEILLVVIGILIALQINNWNEERKIHIYEQKILSDLLHTIDNDLAVQKMLLRRLDSMEFGISNIYRLMGKNESSEDSIQKYLPYFQFGIRFSYDPGAYESLKSVGLDKVTDNSIRAGLAHLYDFQYPRTSSMIEDEYKKPRLEAENLLDKFLVNEVEVNAKGEPTISSKIEINDPFHNQDFLNCIRTYSFVVKQGRFRIEDIMNALNRVKKSLEDYIDK